MHSWAWAPRRSGWVTPPKALTNLLDAVGRFSVLGSTIYRPDTYRYLASAELALGDLDAALTAAHRSLDFAQRADAQHQVRATQRVLAEIELARGHTGVAYELLEASPGSPGALGDETELARLQPLPQTISVE